MNNIYGNVKKIRQATKRNILSAVLLLNLLNTVNQVLVVLAVLIADRLGRLIERRCTKG